MSVARPSLDENERVFQNRLALWMGPSIKYVTLEGVRGSEKV